MVSSDFGKLEVRRHLISGELCAIAGAATPASPAEPTAANGAPGAPAQAAGVLEKPDGADIAVEAVRDELEVARLCAGREERDVIREDLAGDPLGDRRGRDRARCRDARAPDPARDAGRLIPARVPRATSERGEALPRVVHLRREDGRWRFVRRDMRFRHYVPIQQGWATSPS